MTQFSVTVTFNKLFLHVESQESPHGFNTSNICPFHHPTGVYNCFTGVYSEGARCLWNVHRDRRRGSRQKMKDGKCWLDIRKNIFTVTAVKYLKRLFRETVEFPALEIFKDNGTRPWTCFKIALNELRKSHINLFSSIFLYSICLQMVFTNGS